MEKEWIIGITGASGAVYGMRLIHFLLSKGYPLHIIITEAGWRVIKEELDWKVNRRQELLAQQFGHYHADWHYHPIQDIGAIIASGSYNTAGMVIMPCSMGTLASVAHGLSDNLMERAADVMLKEGRKLIIVPRETPLHAVHLNNMLTLAQMGVRIIPAMPAFYHKPQNLDAIIAFMVGKVLDNMGISHELYRRWGAVDEQGTSDPDRTD